MSKGRFRAWLATCAAMVVLAGVLVPSIALAHAGSGPVHGFFAGLAHPFSGLDHVTIMIAIGVLAVHVGGDAMLVLPLGFLGAMLLGALFGFASLDLAVVGRIIALGAYVFGAAALLRFRLGLVAAAVVTGALGVGHGFLQVVEMPEATSPATFTAGFMAAAAGLHLVGIVLGAFIDTIVVGEIRRLTRRL